MTANAISGQEPDESPADQQPTSEADNTSHEIVHSAGDWMLLVTAEGYVEAREDGGPYEGARYFTTRSEVWAPRGADYRYGKSIEDVLARYTHETRFERDADEHGAALRRGIISTLQSFATDVVCDQRECDGCVPHVRHVNAPTGPETAIVCGESATDGRYVTNHPLTVGEQEESR
ncbi:hypothetical protein [Halococcus thailandensis]|uniref:Uncharacterized protein n=1 Tax=Halococcus thailandensis JCM 13552 TaxID=1227457 RepID=M0NDJ9_9EURY|nr:hypothetical protein [Halococcus thailandensis]EMA56032.1 hypothetical protein C451_04501 [Halococcus thailandensis JCM 13552]